MSSLPCVLINPEGRRLLSVDILEALKLVLLPSKLGGLKTSDVIVSDAVFRIIMINA
jgi:hypothetical protein